MATTPIQEALGRLHRNLAAQGPTVTLDREVLGGDRITGPWDRLLGRPTLTLAEAVVATPDAHGTFTVSGTASLYGNGRIPVEVDVFAAAVVAEPGVEADPEVHVVVRGMAPSTAPWQPAGGTADLPGHLDVSTGEPAPSPLAGLSLPAATVVLASLDVVDAVLPPGPLAERLGVDGQPIREGLTLASTLDTSGDAWRTVRTIVDLEAQTAVTAVVGVDGEGTEVELRVDLASRWTLAPGLEVVVDTVVLHGGLHPAGAPATVTLLGRVVIGEPVSVAITVNLGDPRVRVTAGDHDHPLTIPAVLSALGLEPDLTGALPDGIAAVGLSWLDVEVDLHPARVASISIAVAGQAPITLLDDLVELIPSVVLETSDPFGPDASTDVTIAGRWTIGGTAFDVVAHPLSGAVGVRLLPGERLDVDALLAHLAPGAPALHSALDDVELTGSLVTAGYRLRLHASEALELPLGPAALVVHDVGVTATRDHRDQALRWNLTGSLALAGVHLLAAADRTGDGDWRLEARGRVDEAVDLAGLLRHVLELVEPDGHAWHPGLPETYASLEVREIVLHHDTAEATTQVYAALAMDVGVLHGITFDHLTTAIELHDGRLADAWVAAGITIGGVDLVLESRYDEAAGLELHGETGEDQAIPIGEALAGAARLAGVESAVPDVLEGLVAEGLAVTYRTRTRDLLLHLSGTLPGTRDVGIELTVELTHAVVDGASVYTRHLHAMLTLGDLRLDADLSRTSDTGGGGATIVATATAETAGGVAGRVALRPLVARLDDALALHVPAAMALGLREVLLIHQRRATSSRTLLALAIDAGLDLSGLPLIGEALGTELRISLEPVIVSAALTAEDLTALSPLLAHGPISLPADGIDAGLHLETTLRAGQQTWRLGLPVGLEDSGTVTAGPPPPRTPETPTADSGALKWFSVGRTFGPAHLSRVGVGFAGGEIAAAVDGTVMLGPLTLELLGLTASTPIDRPAPRFGLHGLGLDYRSGDLELGGAFLRSQVLRAGVVEEEYAGKVVLRTPGFSLSALGAYSRHDGHPSMFIYAVLAMPLGGPTFFFVTGLALGFGYNRALVMPPIDDVASFPLVQEAMGTTSGAPSLGEELTRLGNAVPPRTGAMFLTAGVRFSSFELIDSFVLLAVQIGPRLEVDLLGLSRAVVPPPEAAAVIDPLARIELAIAARFLPDEGTLEVRGQLTSASYVLSRDCRLHGGFAFSVWFGPDHEGDFVVTLGGYHPHYRRPDHFPVVPRLSFSWQVDAKLLVHGDVYFALTPSALMAGAHLDATWHSGSLRAWFSAGIDLLVAWKPYHYEASLSVHLGGSYTYELFGTHHLTVSLSAELEIWGPPFAGRADIDLGIVSATVRFGPDRPALAPLDWPTFTASFLPDPAEVCRIVVADGLRQTLDGQPLDGRPVAAAVVDGSDLRVRISSRVPISHEPGVAVGIGPMALPAGRLFAPLTVSIRDEDDVAVDALFDVVPVVAGVPAALWDGALRPGLNGSRLVDGVVVGLDVTPRDPHPPAATAAVDAALLAYDTAVVPVAVDEPATSPPHIRAELAVAALEGRFTDGAAAGRRRQLTDALRLRFTPDVVPGRHLAEMLRESPRVWLEPALIPR